MEWLQRVGIRTVEDIKTNGPQATYQLLLHEGHPEDEHFYYALFGAAADVDTIEIMENIKEQEFLKGR